MSNFVVMNHPLIVHKISLLKDKQTGAKDFKSIVKEVSMLLAYELTRDLTLKEVFVETPNGVAKTQMAAGKAIAFVPILRSGIGMVDGLLELLPNAKVGHIGVYRDPKTGTAVSYYCKLPVDIDQREVIICEPMLATGVTAIAAIDALKKAGTKNIKFVTLLASPEGLAAVEKVHPDVVVFCASVGEKLNDKNFIVPGFGDAGDRLFGTK